MKRGKGGTQKRNPAMHKQPRREPKPLTVEPHGVYRPGYLQEALGLSRSSIMREIRLGRLRVAKRCGRYFVLGGWLTEWLRAGEKVRRRNVLNGDGKALQEQESGI
jgi:hypothetical protein